MYKFQLLIILLSLSLLGHAQIKIWENPKSNKAIEITQWEVNDLVYQLKKEVENPFVTEAYAVVKSETGEQKVPLFFDGNKKWVFRYSSSTVGEKAFVIESDIKELNGKKGSFVVSPNQKENRHGGIVLNKDYPNRFFYEDGKHYFNLAFECDWLFALDYGKDEIKKTKHLLNLIEKNGFNQVVMNVYAYDVDTNWVQDALLAKHPEHNYGSREDIFPFLGSNSNPDYSALNFDFFQHFDKIIAEMHEREIVSHLMVYVWNKLVNWPEPGSHADDMYYDYVIKRYQAFPNIIWDVSKEATSKIALEKFDNIAEHIRERCIRTREIDAFDRLVSVHAYGFCVKNKDVVDFMSTQDWKLSIYESMLNAYKQHSDKPVFNIEHGGYEESPYNMFPGGYSNAEACLRRNYHCLFAGTYTTYYWQATSWSAVIHNPFEQPEDFYKPRFDYFKHLKGFFNQVNYEKFEPHQGKVTRSHKLVNYEEGILLQYLQHDVHSDDLKNLLDNEFNYENATWQWFNTLSGEYTELEKVNFPNKYGFWDWRPWRNEADAILIIRNLEKKQ